MASFRYTGTVTHIGFTEHITEKFSKRIIVVSDLTERYPQEVSFEFNNDNTDMLDNFSIGSLVDIEFNLKGRKWINKDEMCVWFNTIQGWKISRVQVDSGNNAPPVAQENGNDNPSDDLPF